MKPTNLITFRQDENNPSKFIINRWCKPYSVFNSGKIENQSVTLVPTSKYKGKISNSIPELSIVVKNKHLTGLFFENYESDKFWTAYGDNRVDFYYIKRRDSHLAIYVFEGLAKQRKVLIKVIQTGAFFESFCHLECIEDYVNINNSKIKSITDG